MTKTSRPLESQVADALRFPLTVLVLWTHCVLVRHNEVVTYWDWAGMHLFFEQFVRGFGPVGVGLFAIISGYYIYPRSGDLSMGYYQEAVRKRFWSLFVPTLLWSALTILALWAKNSIASALGYAPGVVEVELEILRSVDLGSLFTHTIHGSLWYVRELVYLTLLLPVVYIGLRTLRWGFIVLLLAIRFCALPLWWPASLDISIHFSLGLWLAMTGRTILDLVPRALWAKVLAISLAVCFPLVLNFMPGLWGYAFCRFATQSAWLLLLLWWGRRLVLRGSSGRGLSAGLLSVCQSWGGASFFIYAAHTVLWINLFRGILYTTPLAQYAWGPSVIFVLTAVLTTFACMLSYRVLQRIAPRLLTILMGGR